MYTPGVSYCINLFACLFIFFYERVDNKNIIHPTIQLQEQDKNRWGEKKLTIKICMQFVYTWLNIYKNKGCHVSSKLANDYMAIQGK